MEVFISTIAVAVALGCLIALVISSMRDRRRVQAARDVRRKPRQDSDTA